MGIISEIGQILQNKIEAGLRFIKQKYHQIAGTHPQTDPDQGAPSNQDIRPANPLSPRPRKPVGKIRRHSKQRVYRLKGYTTVAKINRKRQSERQQRFLRRLLIGIVFILLLILIFNLYNPVRDLTEWYRIIGIEDLSDLTQNSTATVVGTSLPTTSDNLSTINTTD